MKFEAYIYLVLKSTFSSMYTTDNDWILCFLQTKFNIKHSIELTYVNIWEMVY